MNTLLIVEDEKITRQGIKTMVQRSGVPIDNILECNNGETALEIMRTHEVDVLFTDIQMPKMNGIELVKQLQEFEEIPYIVAISGYDDFSYAVEMLRLNVKDYLLKPIEREKVKEVLEALNEELERKNKAIRDDLTIGAQQLKYAILNDNLPETERAVLIEQYGNDFLRNEYQIVCTNDMGGSIEVEPDAPYIFLADVDGTELYLVEKSYITPLLKGELLQRFVGVSGVHSGLESLKESYREALYARKEAFFQNRNVVFYDEISFEDRTKEALRIDAKNVVQVVQMLGTDKYEEAMRKLERIFKNASLGSYTHREMEDTIQLLLKEIQRTYQNAITRENLEMNSLYALYGGANLEEYQEELFGWIANLAEILNLKFDDYKNKQKMEQAISYIKDNYAKELNMAIVSNHISMNYSLFSFVFKQYTGTNFVNYLKEIRIAKARELLEETDLKIIEISNMVGYENEKHFMKTFKTVCGVSPSEYRKNAQLKG